MGNDVHTYIILEGDSGQIEHFINHHKKSIGDTDIWDCDKFLIEKECKEFIENKDKYYTTGGRFKQGKNSKNIDYIYLSSKNGFCDDVIKVLSKYYDNLTIKLDYKDGDYEMGIGWLVIKDGQVLGEDYISLYNQVDNGNIVKDNRYLINNEISIFGNMEDVNKFISDNKDEYDLDIDENVINFKTEEWPCYEWFIDIIKKYPMLKISLIYKDITNKKYTGYSIAVDGVIIASEFIYLESEFDDELNYFKYDDFMSYKGDHSYNFLPDSDSD
jgi:hypothetical protein